MHGLADGARTGAPRSRLMLRVALCGLLWALAPAVSAQTLSSSTHNACLDEANALYFKKNYVEALARLECARALESDNPEVYNTRGAVLLAQGQTDAALQAFSQAIALAPGDSRWYGNRGGAYKDAGNFKAAIADLDHAIELDPTNVAAHYTRGNVHGTENRLQAAIADYDALLRLDPNYERAYYSRGYAWFLSGEYPRSVADFTQAIALNGSKSDYFNRRAMAYLKLNQLDRALTDIDSALRLDPGKQNYLSNRELILAARASQAPASAALQTPTANATATGSVLASAEIGPRGGVLAGAGKLSINFPAGAVSAPQTLTLRQTLNGSGIQFYQVDSGNRAHLELAAPAQLSFNVPAGENPSDIRVIAELTQDSWWLLPSHYDASTRQITAKVSQFSGVGTYNAIRRGTLGFSIGAAASGLALFFFAPATVPAAAVLIVVGAGTAGAATANPLWEEATRMGYDRHFSVSMTPGKTDFTFHFVGRDFSGEHELWTLGLNKQGQAISATRGSKNLQQIIGLYQDNLQGEARAFGPHEIVDLVRIPERMWLVAKAFVEIKLYFSIPGADYQPPDSIEVLLTDDLPYTRGSQDDGEWDGTFLKININSARSLIDAAGQVVPEAALKLKAYAGHEYWHAIWDKNGYRNPRGLEWLNEALATAFETEVAPGFDGTFVPYPGSSFAEEAERGLLHTNSPYPLWPIARYLLQTPGETRAERHARILALVTGKRNLSDFAGELGVWNRVIESVTTTEHALSDPVMDQRPWHGRPDLISSLSVRTGWSLLGPKDLFETAGTSASRGFGRLEPGKNTVPPAPALSYLMRVVKAEVPQIPGQAGAPAKLPSLVIRRDPGSGAEQLIAYRPAVTPGVGPNIGPRRSIKDQLRGQQRLLLSPEWLLATAAGRRDFLLPVGFLRTDGSEASAPAEPVLVYFLMPPRNPQALWGSGNRSLRLQWDEPDLGKGMSTAEVLRGYRIVVQVDSQARELSERLLAPGTTTVEVGFDELFPLDADVPVDPVTQAAIGLYSVDRVMQTGQGQALASPVAWATASNQKPVAVALTTLYCRPYCSAGLSSGCRTFPMHIYHANQQLGLESLEVPFLYQSTFKEADGKESAFQGGDSIRFQQFTNFPYRADGSFGRSFTQEDTELRGTAGYQIKGRIEVSGRWTDTTANFQVTFPDIAAPDSQWEYNRRGSGGSVSYRCDGNPG